MKIGGIYKIQSEIKPERFYVGSAGTLNNRWHLHLRQLRANKHHSIKLQRHYNKYGEEDLIFSVIQNCNNEDLIKEEQKYIDLYKPYFNVNSYAVSCRGTKRSDETKKKISEAHKGKICHTSKHTEESKKKMSERKKGWRPTTEMRENMRRGQLGRKLSEEARMKISIKNKGKVVSEYTREKIRQSHLGLKPSLETKLKMSVASKGKKKTEEHSKNISLGRKGFKLSEEAKRKLSVWHKGIKLINNKYIKNEAAA